MSAGDLARAPPGTLHVVATLERAKGTDVASLARLADEKGQLESRRDGALTALATRAGVAIPDLRSVRLTGWADEVRPAVIGELACVTFLAEQVATLAAELDELRAELRASKKGASR